MSSFPRPSFDLFQSRFVLSEPDLKISLARLLSEIKERRQVGSPSSVEFFSNVCQWLFRIRGLHHAETRMACLYDAARFLFSNGRGRDALTAADHVRELAAKVQNKHWQRKGETLSGVILADVGNVADALSHYANALTLSRELRELDAEVANLVNLGAALNYAGLFRDAIPCFQRGASLANSTGEPDMEAAALTNMAQSHWYLGEFRKALKAAGRALQVSQRPYDSDSHLTMAIREFTYIQVALELGMFDDAKAHCLRCHDYANASNTPRAITLASIVESLWEVKAGDADRGLSALERIYVSTGQAQSLRTDALRALAQAYDLVGKPNEALYYMQLLLDHITRARSESAIALVALRREEAESLLVDEGGQDLAVLQRQEANLRAKVAESNLINSQLEMLERLAITASLKDDPSGEHGFRVGRLSALLARSIGWPPEACYVLEVAARLHDIGKTGIPDGILLSSEKLKAAERRLMSAHCAIGAELLARGNLPELCTAEEIAKFHHERWDGNGYPKGLRGNKIPLHARIVSLADVFDALTHGRPFANAWSIEAALASIQSGRGTQFDPGLADAFVSLIQRLVKEHSSLDVYLTSGNQNSPFVRARKRIGELLAGEYRSAPVN